MIEIYPSCSISLLYCSTVYEQNHIHPLHITYNYLLSSNRMLQCSLSSFSYHLASALSYYNLASSLEQPISILRLCMSCLSSIHHHCQRNSLLASRHPRSSFTPFPHHTPLTSPSRPHRRPLNLTPPLLNPNSIPTLTSPDLQQLSTKSPS